MSDESKAKAEALARRLAWEMRYGVSEHAEVKQEHRREAKRFCDAVDFLEEDELAQFLADHDAELERRLLRNFLSDSISHDEHVHGVRDSCWLCNTLGGTNG